MMQRNSHKTLYTFECQEPVAGCLGPLTLPLDLEGLSEQQVDDVVQKSLVELTAEDIENNQLQLTKSAKEELAELGFVRRAMSFPQTICDACGSNA